MTRANLTIIDTDGFKHKFQWMSDAYPENVRDVLVAIAGDELNTDCTIESMAHYNQQGGASFLYLGHVGNPYYIYEIDLSARRVRGWETRTRWVHAPADWHERGWHCYIGRNGSIGYTTWVKGKQIMDLTCPPTQILQEA